MPNDNPFDDEVGAHAGRIDLRSIGDATALVEAVGAAEVLGLLQRLGFWIGEGRNPSVAERAFVVDLANLSPAQLGNDSGYWQSELSRVVSILGALRGQERLARHRVARAKEHAAAEMLRAHTAEKTKPPTKAALDVLVADRPEVVALEERAAVLDSVIITLDAARDAIEGYCRVLSREMTRRGDLLRSGLG